MKNAMSRDEIIAQLNDKEMNTRIDRYASRISGKPTCTPVLTMMRVVYKENELPSIEYLRTYLKLYNS